MTLVAMTEEHISDETLAAFIDGRADPETRNRVLEHLADCPDCYATWESAADYAALEAEEQQAPNVRQGQFGGHRPPWRGWGAIAAAVVIALVGAAFLRERMLSTATDLIALKSAAEKQDSRATLARLSGFPYREFKVTRGSGDKDPWSDDAVSVAEIALAIEGKANRRRSVENLHALAVAHLVQKEPDLAVAAIEEALRAATGTSDVLAAFKKIHDAALLNDASAVYYARGSSASRQPSDYAFALAAAEAARNVTNTPESLWNRAAALEALEQRDAARAAWQEYLKTDQTSPWAVEVQRRIDNPIE